MTKTGKTGATRSGGPARPGTPAQTGATEIKGAPATQVVRSTNYAIAAAAGPVEQESRLRLASDHVHGRPRPGGNHSGELPGLRAGGGRPVGEVRAPVDRGRR